ncbi:MAG: cytochrome c maturation protein CcmE [Candidatus Methanosuratincola sp.]|jgi:cytochrome c-type biogenesis protein CcmE
MRVRRVKFIVAIAAIATALSYLVYAGVRETFVYYLTIEEMLARVPAIYDSKVRVSGEVVPGSINRDADGNLSFAMTDGKHKVNVEYRGVVPDIFADNVEAIVEGRYTPVGVFKANVLLAKCPTKYESVEGLKPGGKGGGDKGLEYIKPYGSGSRKEESI